MNYTRRGDTIYFGNYYYEGKTKEPIAWDILEERDGKALIVTRYIIDTKRFFSDANSYAESHIRKWLNSNFYNEAFNSSERCIIQQTKVDNSLESTLTRTNDYICRDTYDKIFLLSCKEVMDYIPQSQRYVKCTPHAKNQGLATYFQVGDWWLRSPCQFYYPTKVFVVVHDGSIGGEYVDTNSIGVRPACWIKL